jgi:hypothetical protein
VAIELFSILAIITIQWEFPFQHLKQHIMKLLAMLPLNVYSAVLWNLHLNAADALLHIVSAL